MPMITRETRVHRLLASPFLQVIAVLISLAIAFSGKISTNGIAVSLLVAGIVGAFGIWHRLFRPNWRGLICVVVIVLYAGTLHWFFNFLTEINLDDSGRIAITKVEPMSLPDRPIAFKVYFTNIGKRPVLGLKRSPTLRVTDVPLPRNEEDDGMKICFGTTIVQDSDKNEIQPGETFFNIVTGPFSEAQRAQVLQGKALVYLMLVAIYRDARTPRDKSIVTEFCASLAGVMDTYISCQDHNKVYLNPRVFEPD